MHNHINFTQPHLLPKYLRNLSVRNNFTLSDFRRANKFILAFVLSGGTSPSAENEISEAPLGSNLAGRYASTVARPLLLILWGLTNYVHACTIWRPCCRRQEE